jgi:uncharacterized protein (TIGR00725 family)
MSPHPPHVAVVGAGECGDEEAARAAEVGRRLAEAGAVVVCGGLGGVMEAACRGARAAGGTTVGLLPDDNRARANPHLTVALATGLGEIRNTLIVRDADAVVAIAGGYGTLSEIAFALRIGKRVIGLATWDVRGVEAASDPADAVARALR